MLSRRVDKRHLALIIAAIFAINSLVVFPIDHGQKAYALSAITSANRSAYTSLGAYSLQDRGGGVYNNGTMIFIAEASSSAIKASGYDIGADSLTTRTASVNLISAPANPSSAVASSTTTNTEFTQSLGGSDQLLRTTSTTFVVEVAATASSQLVGMEINSATVSLKKTGAATGTASICVFNAVGNCGYTFGTQDCAALTAAYQSLTYTGTAAPHTISTSDRIGVYFNGGSAGNECVVEYQNANVFDGTVNSFVQTGTGAAGAAAWTSQTARELKLTLGLVNQASYVNDDSSTTYWQNNGFQVRATQSNDGATTSIGSGFSGSVAIASEKKTTSSTLANVNVDSIDLRLSKTGSPTGTGTVAEFDNDGSVTSKLNQNLGAHSDLVIGNSVGNMAAAEKITSAGALIGQSVNSVTAAIRKVSTPTATMTACIMDSSSNCVYTFGSIASSTLTTSYVAHTFTNYASSHTIATDDYIGFKMETALTGIQQVQISASSANPYDGTNSFVAQFSAGAWVDATAWDLGSSTASQNWKLDLITLPTVLNTFGTIDVSTLTTSAATYTFTAGADFTLSNAETTYVGILYTGGSLGNTVEVTRSTADSYDGTTNSVFATFSQAGYTDTTTSDLTFRITDTDQETLPVMIYINLGSAQNVGGIRLNFPDATKIPQEMNISSSADAISWTIRRSTFTPAQTTGNQIIELLDGSASAQYWQISIISWGSDQLFALAEYDFVRAGVQEVALSNIGTDESLFTYACSTAAACGNTGVAYLSRIDLTKLVRGDNQYTDVSTTRTWPAGQDGAAAFGGATNNGVYLLEVDCTCTRDDYDLIRFSYDLSSVSAVVSWTETVDWGSNQNIWNGRIVAWNTGGADTVVMGVSASTTKFVFYESSTKLGLVAINPGYEPVAFALSDGDVHYTLATAASPTDKTTVIVDTVSNSIDSSSVTTDFTSFPASNGVLRTSGSVSFDTDENSIYLATALLSYGWDASDAESKPTVFYVASTTPGTGTLNGIGSAKFYWLKDNLWIESSSASSSSWTFKEVTSSNSLTITPYEEQVNSALVANNTSPTFGNTGLVKIVCDASYTTYSILLATGDYSDCDFWITLATASATIGREISHVAGFDATPDLVHATVYTAYALQLQTSNPQDYSWSLAYRGVVADTGSFDAAGTSQARLLYGNCYTLVVYNEVNGASTNLGDTCANDFTTKTISFSGITVPSTWVGSDWRCSIERNFGTEPAPDPPITGTGNATVFVTRTIATESPQPLFNVSIMYTDSWMSDKRTFETWYNFTNVNGTASQFVTPIPNNATRFFVIYDTNTGNPKLDCVTNGNTIVLTNPLSPLGSIFGISLPTIFAILVVAVFPKQYAPFGLLVGGVTIGILAAAQLMPDVTTGIMSIIIVTIAVGLIYGYKKF